MPKPSLIINTRNFTDRIATYTVSKEITYKSVITTRDGVEKPSQQRIRTIIDFSLLPASPDVFAADFNALKGSVYVQFFDPYINGTRMLAMRLDGTMEEAFALSAVDGKMYYTGKVIRLRGNGVG